MERGKKLIEEHYDSPVRAQTVSVRLLEIHAEYARLLAEFLSAKAEGASPEEAEKILMKGAADYMSGMEPITERYFDFELAIQIILRIARAKYVPPVQF